MANSHLTLAQSHRDAALYWSDTNDKTPNDYSPSSAHIVAWKCPICAFSWNKKISEWSRFPSCPACMARRNGKTEIGVNDLATTNKALIGQYWDYERNTLPPTCYTATSKSKVFWKDLNEKEQITRFIQEKSKSQNTSSVLHTNPELVKWFQDKKVAETVSSKSNKIIDFQCIKHKEHKWESSMKNFLKKKNKCPYCSSQKLLVGFNDLKTTHPDLAKELIGISPEKIMANSTVAYKWRCNLQHEWEAVVAYRVAGNNCPVCANKKLLVGFNDLATIVPNILKSWDSSSTPHPSQVCSGSDTKISLICECSSPFKLPAYHISRKNKVKMFSCPKCKETTGEKLIRIFLEAENVNFVQNSRNIIDGKELDFYLPDYNVAIEFNGLYWHSDIFKDSSYHADKWLDCHGKGIQLITVWEDDLARFDLVREMILHKLNLSKRKRLNARSLDVVVVSKKEVMPFLVANHIQGYVASSVYYGLADGDGVLHAVMSFSSAESYWTLTRFATSDVVRGGFSKLLKYAMKDLPYKGMIRTFASRDVSDGGLYETNGFVVSGVIKPDYMYVVGQERKHKFNYRVSRFKRDPELLYVDGFSEAELAELNGLSRVWDSGKVIYDLKF